MSGINPERERGMPAEQNKEATNRKDDVRQADESGEPRRSGWAHGHPVDEDDPRQQAGRAAGNDTNPDRPADKKGGDVGEDLESGRQGSV
jgi:hypothetical protein